MYEKILTAIFRRDETITFIRIEPLNCTFTHTFLFYSISRYSQDSAPPLYPPNRPIVQMPDMGLLANLGRACSKCQVGSICSAAQCAWSHFWLDPHHALEWLHANRTATKRHPARAADQSYPGRLATRFSTTEGSASVLVSPRLSNSFSAILRRMRRMILPERVLGRPGAH